MHDRSKRDIEPASDSKSLALPIELTVQPVPSQIVCEDLWDSVTPKRL